MGKQTGSRMVNRARYEELLRAELDEYNDKLGPHSRREIFFDALLCRRRVTSQMRWRVYKKLRELGFSLPAIAKVAGFHHTTVLHGLYALQGVQRRFAPSQSRRKALRTYSVPGATDPNNSAGKHRNEPAQSADASQAESRHSL